MKLKERFRRLTLWNKIGTCGALVSFIGVPLAFALWYFPRSAPSTMDWPLALSQLRTLEERSKGDAFLTRTFWLSREAGTTIGLGECPGADCMKFTLGKLKQEGGSFIQEILLIGDGFGVKRPPQTKYQFALDNAVRVKGAGLTFMFDKGPLIVKFRLQTGAVFEMFTPKADFTFSVVDLRTDSLRIRLDVKPPSGASLD